jgi:DNA-binding transcriptional LysR family regulator
MERQGTMHGVRQLIAFAETAKYGSFAAAARETGQAPSTLAKAVARLEASLGVKLFHRTTRQVTTTPDGERLFQRCQRVLAEIEDLHAEAAGTRAAPSGVLRVAAPVYYGKRFVMPILAQLQQRHPGLRLDIRLSDQWVDLVRDGIDIAVRIGHLSDSTLVVRRVDRQALCLCASAGYVAAHGAPRRIEELSAHPAVVFRLPTSGRDRPWQLGQRGLALELNAEPAVRVNETEGLRTALLLGQGIGQIPDNVVADDLASGRLVEVLPSIRPEAAPIQVLYPSARLVPARVRVAIEALDALRRRQTG